MMWLPILSIASINFQSQTCFNHTEYVIFVKKKSDMTKSIIITYNEADESQLMIMFRKFKVKIEAYKQPHTADTQYKNKENIKDDIREAVADMHADMRGEIELPDFFESLKRIEKELAEEKNL